MKLLTATTLFVALTAVTAAVTPNPDLESRLIQGKTNLFTIGDFDADMLVERQQQCSNSGGSCSIGNNRISCCPGLVCRRRQFGFLVSFPSLQSQMYLELILSLSLEPVAPSLYLLGESPA